MTDELLSPKFTEHERTILGRIADSLTAWLGRAIVCVIDELDNGYEYAMFTMPLQEDEEEDEEVDADDTSIVPVGGDENLYLLGSAGGIPDIQTEVYAARVVRSVLLLDHQPDQPRFAIINGDLEEEGFAYEIEEIADFSMNEPEENGDDEDEYVSADELDEDDDDLTEEELMALFLSQTPTSPTKH